MSDQAVQTPAAPLPSGEQIYDSIMSTIEPELVTESLKKLAEKYKNETPEEAKARTERYNEAFKKYDEIYNKFVVEVEQKIHTYKRQALASAEKQERAKDEAELSQLESAISTL